MKKNNIVLVGFMGTGKSTIGRALSDRLGWRFVDTDALIEQKEGTSIPEVFSLKGEPYFRQVEKQVIEEVMDRQWQIVSTGGGAVLARENCDRMLRSGFVVALSASAEVLIHRLKHDENRPLLQGNVEKRVHLLLEQRRHAYDFADLRIDTSDMSVNAIVDLIMQTKKETV